MSTTTITVRGPRRNTSTSICRAKHTIQPQITGISTLTDPEHVPFCVLCFAVPRIVAGIGAGIQPARLKRGPGERAVGRRY
ncbi:MAG TPA: hypothetical protein VMK12_24205 [Anaeromyxobacteraceae bacterium]|nr:hypothetical protein [Anaeromyxobacteraceae bacterium]